MAKKYELVYKTSTSPFFPMCLVAQNYGNRTLKELFGLDLSLPVSVLCVINNGTINWFLEKKCRNISRQLFDEFFSDSKYLENIRKKEKEFSQKLMAKIKMPPERLFENRVLSRRGEGELRKIIKYYIEHAYFTDMPGLLFQLYYTDKIKEEFFKALKGRSEKEKNELFNLVFSSPQKTNYEKFLFKIYEYILLNKKINNLEKIAEGFYWVIHDYLGEIVDVKYLEREIKKFRKKPEKEMKKEIKEVEERIAKIREIEKKFPRKILRKIKIIQAMLYLYNERKKYVLNKANVYFRKVIEYKFPNVRFSELKKIYQLTPEEIIRLLKGEKIKDLEKRDKKWVYSLQAAQIKNEDLRYFRLVEPKKKTGRLIGTPASPGKAKGKINIILNISQIPKFKEGDILVAPFTNVNYLPAMRDARAILTETGGLTSHAAIVSRELKKPCIVGIKELIASLEDGDLVEADAERGIVKVLGKK